MHINYELLLILLKGNDHWSGFFAYCPNKVLISKWDYIHLRLHGCFWLVFAIWQCEALINRDYYIINCEHSRASEKTFISPVCDITSRKLVIKKNTRHVIHPPANCSVCLDIFSSSTFIFTQASHTHTLLVKKSPFTL